MTDEHHPIPHSIPLDVYQIDSIDYKSAWDLQKHLVQLRKQDHIQDTLLIVQHTPVITVGRNVDETHVLHTPSQLKALGFDYMKTDRGGDATYHGPGQLVAYPIINLSPHMKDVPRFVRTLEQVVIDVLAQYQLHATRLQGAPGVWLSDPDRKIAAIGARITRWVTYHGLALNVNTDLSHFDVIVPCGLSGKGVSSLQKELHTSISYTEVVQVFLQCFAHNFKRQLCVHQALPVDWLQPKSTS